MKKNELDEIIDLASGICADYERLTEYLPSVKKPIYDGYRAFLAIKGALEMVEVEDEPAPSEDPWGGFSDPYNE